MTFSDHLVVQTTNFEKHFIVYFVKIRAVITAFSFFSSLALGINLAKASEIKPILVALDGVLCDLVRTVTSNSADVFCIIPPTGDPHFYRLKPKDLKAIAKAIASSTDS